MGLARDSPPAVPGSPPPPTAADAALFAAGRARRRRIASFATLGSGASGRVRGAVCLDSGQRVALKSCSAPASQRDALRARFRAVAKLNHPNLCRLLELIEVEGKVYTVMELCATDLEAYLHSHGPIPERSLRPILRSILSALAYLHANGVAHRDLKPSNVLLRRPEEDPSDLAVADFDAAGVCSSSPNFFFAQAPFQTIAGTPFYLAPEIVRGAAYGSEVDMWALGCIAVELATGSTPFGGAANFGELYASIELGRWGGLPAGFSAAFRDLVGRMLVVDQRERMTAAEALAHPWFWESWESRGGGRQQGPTGAGAWVTFDEGTGELRCVAA